MRSARRALADVVRDENDGELTLLPDAPSSPWSRSRNIAAERSNGSSMRSMSASWASAGERDLLPHPADSSCGRRPANSARPTRASSCSARWWRPRTPSSRNGSSTLRDGQPREQRRLLEHQRRPAVDGDRTGSRGVQSSGEVEQRRPLRSRRRRRGRAADPATRRGRCRRGRPPHPCPDRTPCARRCAPRDRFADAVRRPRRRGFGDERHRPATGARPVSASTSLSRSTE